MSRQNYQRKTDFYSVHIINQKTDSVHTGKYKINSILQSFINDSFTGGATYTVNDSNKDMKYYIKAKGKINNPHNIQCIKWAYIKYNKETPIVNINTKKQTKAKGKNEGDEEKQHLSVRYYTEKDNVAAIAFEKIQGAISIKNIEYELNKYIKEKTLMPNYLVIEMHSLPSEEFIKSLKAMNRITLVELTADKNLAAIDEDLQFSGDNENERDAFELKYKAKRAASLPKKDIESFFKKYKAHNGKGKILRVKVSGNGANGIVRLDTEYAKLSTHSKVDVDASGNVDTDKLFSIQNELLESITVDALNIILE